MTYLNRVFYAIFGASLILAATSLSSSAADRRIYVFGNSLIHHLSDTSETTVPYWLQHIASHGSGNKFTLDGQWGFLSEFHSKLPPVAQWNFKGVKRAWTSAGRPFEQAGFDTIIVNPSNFEQYRSPTAIYEANPPTDVSPLTAAEKLFDWLKPRTQSAQFFVYEGWADMGGMAPNFPPSAAILAKYHRKNLADYHDWYEELVDTINKTDKFGRVRLIPASSVIAMLMTETELSTLTATDLYSDDAPHGTPNTYFLAALVTYAALFDKRPPTELPLPASIHPTIKSNLALIADMICANLHIECKD